MAEPELVVVTGAGSGLGRALAHEYKAQNKIDYGIGQNAETHEATQQMVGCNHFHFAVADVADPAAVRDAFSRIDELNVPLLVLVNNAAIYETFDILERPAEDYLRTLAVNTGGMINCAHAALTRMVTTGRGRILNVASFADLSPLPSSGAYSVSKGACRIFTRALVADLSDRFPEIIVNDWAPGILATRMGRVDGLDPATAAKWGVELALDMSPDLNGCVFDADREILAPRSLRRRLTDLLTLKPAPRARILTGTGGSGATLIRDGV
ncbi:MAG: SDR family oxidoreductase [Pseudomonadota bacterium]